MKNTESGYVCKKHRFVLSKTIETETWLNSMAANGYLLQKIKGRKYYFKQVLPANYRFFVMDPEVGTNSDRWVFFEFEKKGGLKVPHSGTTVFSPRYVLMVNQKTLESSDPHNIIEYYFRYRNYRLLRRFQRNAVFSLILSSFGVIVSCFNFPANLIALSPYLIVSVILCVHFLASFFHLRQMCAKIGDANPTQKPMRPGY